MATVLATAAFLNAIGAIVEVNFEVRKLGEPLWARGDINT
jgi:hypothetical protein